MEDDRADSARFIQAGCSKVYIVARSIEPLQDAAKYLNAIQTPNKHPQAAAIPITGDVSTASGLATIAEEIGKTTDHVNILLANAGATFIGQLEDYTEDDFANVMNVNVNSVFFSIQKYISTPLRNLYIILTCNNSLG